MTIALEDKTPNDCIHSMLAASLDIAGLDVRVEWADLGDDAALWHPEDRTLLVDRENTVPTTLRVLREFVDLCYGRGDGNWQLAKPKLQLVLGGGDR